ncbi:MAG: TadG family pilus assembly protein [Parvibaculum sp.]|uniref:TadG family pilus assembly protein n=1 Tax=Parvibaculum sp. TaxID=2024848 RepID=UPI0032655C0A
MPQPLRVLLRQFAGDERGVISVMAVGALILALAVAMIVIDTGAMLYARRDLQAATDAAALGAVRQLQSQEATQTAAETIFDINGFQTAGTEVARGVYDPDPSKQASSRFIAEGGGIDEADINAVRVRKTASSPTYFARLFGFGSLTGIDAEATAAYVKTVSFSAGTRLAELNDGLANQILGGLLGTTLNLSLVDYNALAAANIDALEFLDALAVEVGLEAGSDTYGDLLDTEVAIGDIVAAAVDVLNGESFEGDPSVAKVALQTALSPVENVTVPLDQILDATPFVNRVIGSIGSSAGDNVPFNVYDILTGTAMVAGEGEVVGFDTDVNLGSLASVSGTISVGSPMAHMAVGKVGDSVQTSQIEIQLNAVIDTGILSLVDSQIAVPVYITAAEGTATVASIPCSDSTVTVLSGTTGATDARYGTESDTTPTIATIELNIGLATVPVMNLKASGSHQLASHGPTDIAFTQTDVDSATIKTISSDSNILSGLGGALTIQQVTLVGISIPGLSTILSTLMSAVGGALTSLDTVLDSLLTTLGVKLGAMDIIVHGAKCRAPVLVG